MISMSKLMRSGLGLLLALCLIISAPVTVLALPASAEEAVADAVDYCHKAQQIVDLIVDIAIEGEYADMFEGSNTSEMVKSMAIDMIIDELDNHEDLMTDFGFEPTDENKQLVADEVYYAACIYYDELHRDGGSQESANRLAVIELIRFALVETEGYAEADAQETAELYHKLNEIYQAEGEDAAVAYAESVLGTGEGTEPTEPEPTEPEPTEPDDPEAEIIRISGSGRCETAIEIADMMKETLGLESFDAIIIANGDNFADALAGSYLASQKNAPILLYRASAVEMNLEYIQKNLSAEGTVYLLGGNSAVPADVEEGLKAAGITVERLSGKSRFDTNLEILREAGIEAGQEILVATGYNFADSLSASATGLPILMVNNGLGELTEAQITFLETLEGCTFTVIGGDSAVSDDLMDAIGAYGDVTRLSGKNREATSVLVAETYFKDPDCVVLAYSRNFPDGLCGGPLAYALGAPLILTNAGQEAVAAEYIAENGITKGLVLGGNSAVSEATVNAVFGLDK